MTTELSVGLVHARTARVKIVLFLKSFWYVNSKTGKNVYETSKTLLSLKLRGYVVGGERVGNSVSDPQHSALELLIKRSAPL